ncbi:MAG: hypothetical protein ABIL07_08005 [candidate division WOR-3 bacterium]
MMMGKIIDLGPDAIDNEFDQIYKQICDRHYQHPTSIVPIELTEEEISQMSVDNALGEYVAQMKSGKFEQPRRIYVKRKK